MKRVVAIAVLSVCCAAPAEAQTKGKVSVGGTVSFLHTTDGEVGSLIGFGPLVRLNPRKGWGVAGGLSWFGADLDNPSGAGGSFARLRVRPLMGGVAYTVGEQPVLVSFSIVAGPSFNDLDFDDDFLRTLPAGALTPEIDIDNSFVVRPGVNLTVTVAPRIAIVGFGGYMFNRPGVIYRDSSGQEFRDRWKADAIAVSVGAVFSVF
jgi:outer membrane protein with beta-barrel domain